MGAFAKFGNAYSVIVELLGGKYCRRNHPKSIWSLYFLLFNPSLTVWTESRLVRLYDCYALLAFLCLCQAQRLCSRC